MILKNGTVFYEDRFEKRDICISDGRIVSQEMYGRLQIENDKVIDAEGMYIIPGMVDIHLHGAVGCDLMDGDDDSLHRFLYFEKSCGVTTVVPASMTASEERLTKAFRTVKDHIRKADEAELAGIHMEGPFISPLKAGAMDRNDICPPDKAMFHRLMYASGGSILLVTMAPEIGNAVNFIREISEEVHVSVGHTACDEETARQAFEAGADHLTHMFNGMPDMLHRAPGPAGAALTNEKVFAELICDGIHNAESVILAAYRMFGDRRLVMISDSAPPTGLPDGEGTLGGRQVFKTGRTVRLPDGTIAGSASTLYDCFLEAIRCGIPLESAVRMTSSTPAKSIGLQEETGMIAEGRKAELLLLDQELKLVRVITG